MKRRLAPPPSFPTSSAASKTWTIYENVLLEQFGMSVSIANLHCVQCQQSDADLQLMSDKLGHDPEALERRAEFSFCGQLTPLQSAVYRNHARCVNFLLDRGAEVNAVTGTGHHTALYISVYRNYLSMVELLLERGASTKSHLPTYANPEGGLLCGSWYFHLAVTFEFFEIAKVLVEYGSNTEDFDEHTGLQILYAAEIASAKASPDILLLALQYGSGPDERIVCKDEVKGPSLVLSTISYKWSIFSDVQVEKLKRVWLILLRFGHDFWCRDKKNRTVIDLLHRKRNKNSELDVPILDTMYQDLLLSLDDIVSNPMRLQDICRLSVRKSVGCRAQTKIDQIDSIPNALKRFLKFEIL